MAESQSGCAGQAMAGSDAIAREEGGGSEDAAAAAGDEWAWAGRRGG
jgi:hypothetical protein